LAQLLECLCGNNIAFMKSSTMTSDVVYKGNSNEVIGKTFEIEVICSKCKRKLDIELSICDNNWE